MFNITSKANNQLIERLAGNQSIHSTDYQEITTFSGGPCQETTYLTKNRYMRDQEWLTEMKIITRAQVVDFRFSVEVLASEMALSRSQLFRKVKDLLGISPNQFIRDIRLEVAKELFENGQVASIKATAYEVGLKDAANFSRMFKEKFGFLPSEYI